MYYITLLDLILLIFIIYIFSISIKSYYIKKEWRDIKSQEIPKEYLNILLKLPYFKLLPQNEKRELLPKMHFFIKTKEFRGVNIEITDEIKTVIAFYACIMVLKIDNECYDELKTIIVYPHDVITKRIEQNGWIYRDSEVILEGETTGDTVVIAWNEAKKEAYHLRHHNVIVHELAHVLDFEDGIPDGIPPLDMIKHDEWSRILYKHFNKLREINRLNRYWGKYRLIGEYATTNEAEFFAVISELYFQSPHTLKKHFPDLYKLLYKFYKIDTFSIFGRAI